MGELLFIILLVWAVFTMKNRSIRNRSQNRRARSGSLRQSDGDGAGAGGGAGAKGSNIRLPDFLNRDPGPIRESDSGKRSSGRRGMSLSAHWGETPLIRDDANDWLSQQLREEERLLKKTSDMFDLKMSHRADCDAGRLKTEHAEHCDADGLKKLFRRS